MLAAANFYIVQRLFGFYIELFPYEVTNEKTTIVSPENKKLGFMHLPQSQNKDVN
jgi:hypothetical protein